MNEAAKTYWESYWGDNVKPPSVSAWQFGDTPDELAKLVINGEKTATSSGYIFYELENEPLPMVEEYSIILNSREEPVAIIITIDVRIIPMNEVTEEFALAEGDGSYQNWKDIHERYYKKELKKVGREYSEDMPLVCERFKLVHVQ